MPVHKELITVGQFDEKFKRALLNYYSYGFMHINSFGRKQRKYKEARTLREDWQRLNRIIADYSEWIEFSNGKSASGKVVYITADSESMEDNPFQRVYRFCGNKPSTFSAFFLHTMAAMSDQIHLRTPLEDDEENPISNQGTFKTSALLAYYTDRLVPPENDDRRRTTNNRLRDLAALGIVASEQNPGSHNRNGDHHWSLPAITMRTLLSAANDMGNAGGFERRFLSAIDFFSRYFLLGEVGMFLKDRMEYDESASAFRFKHDYFMQSLNDFNIVDLLYAIENEKWCKIRYSHGTSDFATELLCYPLQIRISDQNGREYLMYYEPFKRSYTSLRIEFIDSIEYFGREEIGKILSDYHGESGTAENDIENARNALKYCWGVSSAAVVRDGQKTVEGNAVNPVEAASVELQFQYDPQSESYIPLRIQKERRNGLVTEQEDAGSVFFQAKVTDPREMIPWIRSFYTRVQIVHGLDDAEFSIEQDVDRICRLISQEVGLEMPAQKDPPEPWRIPEKIEERLTAGQKAAEHENLFHEVFSTYYYIISDIFARMSACKTDSFPESDFQKFYRQALSVYTARTGLDTEKLLQEIVEDVLLGDDFVQEGTTQFRTEVKYASAWYETKTVDVLIPRYRLSEDIKLYRDIVPLSTYEIRWLKTILDDQKMRYFLDEDNEIRPLKQWLEDNAPHIKPLPMQYVEHFDRFHYQESKTEKEQENISVLLESIQNAAAVFIRYRANNNTLHEGVYYPILIEFSKRNNYFQCICCTPLYDRIITMNASQIEAITITETRFAAWKAHQALQNYRAKQTRTVEVEFYDVRNAVDRILTEFAPWKKECRYDRKTDLYTLKLYYQQQDEKEILIRLMGYGPIIRIKDQTLSIAKEMWKRIESQASRIGLYRRTDNDRNEEDR